MSFLLFVAGCLLFFAQRIRLGEFYAQGPQVKAAGVVLMLPTVIFVLLNQVFVPLSLGNNPGAVTVVTVVLEWVELIAWLIAAGIAYILIADPPEAPRLPGILGVFQQQGRQQKQQPSDEDPTVGVAAHSPAPAQPRSAKIIRLPLAGGVVFTSGVINREHFPSVMGLEEAARYLQTTEEEILRMIDEGRLSAARENYRYQIAKSQLDELL